MEREKERQKSFVEARAKLEKSFFELRMNSEKSMNEQRGDKEEKFLLNHEGSTRKFGLRQGKRQQVLLFCCRLLIGKFFPIRENE